MELGLPVECSDGPCGTVGDVVVDPRQRRVTHLVVEPHHRHHLARLVPIDDLARAETGEALRLERTSAEVTDHPFVEETAFVRLGEWPPLLDRGWDVGVSTVLSLPSYDSAGLGGGIYLPTPYADGMEMAFDRIPAHEVELRRDSIVEDADGSTLGHVDACLVDAAAAITHVIVDRGHLWRRGEVTVPIRAVSDLQTDRIRLAMTADELDRLPSVPAHRRSR